MKGERGKEQVSDNMSYDITPATTKPTQMEDIIRATTGTTMGVQNRYT